LGELIGVSAIDADFRRSCSGTFTAGVIGQFCLRDCRDRKTLTASRCFKHLASWALAEINLTEIDFKMRCANDEPLLDFLMMT
jgi:hypothetical protein